MPEDDQNVPETYIIIHNEVVSDRSLLLVVNSIS